MKKQVNFTCLAIMTILLTSCGNGDENRTSIKSGEQTLTMMDSSTVNLQDPFTVQRINRLDGIQGIRWNSDHEIVYIKWLKTGTDKHNQPVFKSAVGVKDILSGETKDEKPWSPGETRIWSPDSKHAYVWDTYMKGENLYATHSIENGNEGQAVTVPLKAVSGSAAWLDNEHVLYMGGIGDGGVVQVNLQGHVTSLPALSKLMESGDTRYTDTATVGDRLYSLETNYPKAVHRLNYIQLSQLEKPVARTVKDNVLRYQPSADGQTIAIVTTKTTMDASQQLFLIDAEGNQLGKSIAKGILIEQMAWSADDSKLAYGILDKAGNGYQIFVFDIKTGKNTAVFEGSRIAGDLLWSPDGKHLMVPVDRSQSGNQVLPETNILQFK